MMSKQSQSGETAADRKLRRESLLKYGPMFAPALRFPFDQPNNPEEVEITVPETGPKGT
jgi:hypothetical protein